MTFTNFDKYTKEFQSHINYLTNTAENVIPQAREALDASSLPSNAPSNESAAELCLRNLSERIEDIMALHDKIQESIGMPSRYKSFFKSLNLTTTGRQELSRILEEHADDSDQT